MDILEDLRIALMIVAVIYMLRSYIIIEFKNLIHLSLSS